MGWHGKKPILTNPRNDDSKLNFHIIAEKLAKSCVKNVLQKIFYQWLKKVTFPDFSYFRHFYVMTLF